MSEKETTAPAEQTSIPEWDVEANRAPKCDASAERRATLSWNHLRVKVKDTKGNERYILKGITGYVEPRHMLAIMGPSGCGKSTLLDTLAGRLASSAEWDGEIRVNGHKSQLSYGRAAYVTQDEVLIGTLTVEETLMFAARLRLPLTMSTEEKKRIVGGVIQELGLESVKNTYIGNWHIRGISGGQRRRVSIGCELVTSPTLLFLDEPTSGLDSAAAYHVMASVRRLTEGCRTIVTVIHQPSSETFELFDKLCLLASGDTVYFGDALKAQDMFASAGLAVPATRSAPDHFLHAINRDFESETYDVESNIAHLVATYKDSTLADTTKSTVQEFHSNPGEVYEVEKQHPNFVAQTGILTYRTFLNNWRNVGLFWMRLAMYIVLCLAIGFIYFQLGTSWKDVFSRAALLFFVVAFLTFMAIAGFPAFVEDMKVYIRERLNGYYSPVVFTLSNTFASLPFIFVISVVSTVCVYFIAGLSSSGGDVIYFILALFASLTVVESLMMSIAPVVPNFLMGIAAGAGILGIYMVVCGFFQPLNSMPKPIFRYPLSYISFHTYAFTGFMRNEFEGTTGWESPMDPAIEWTGDQVLQYYEIMNINKWICFLILFCMVIFYRLVFLSTLMMKEWMAR